VKVPSIITVEVAARVLRISNYGWFKNLGFSIAGQALS
jgi:hypothetical protein